MLYVTIDFFVTLACNCFIFTGNLFKCHIARLAADLTQEMLNLSFISALAYFTQ